MDTCSTVLAKSFSTISSITTYKNYAASAEACTGIIHVFGLTENNTFETASILKPVKAQSDQDLFVDRTVFSQDGKVCQSCYFVYFKKYFVIAKISAKIQQIFSCSWFLKFPIKSHQDWLFGTGNQPNWSLRLVWRRILQV